jgi:uncharacterized protein (DUF2235 family)
MPPHVPKTIVLFSDGTGNSSAKLFKTNVWRMYEAVDLGPTPPDRRPQISYYDDGVGTSAFKPLAVLGGVFGYGLKRNVLDIYKFACRNYRTDDEIYAFGFSRGAFTTRLVVALIANQGLVQSDDEGSLDCLSRQAYRAFRRVWLPRKLALPTIAVRAVRDAILERWYGWRGLPIYRRKDCQRPPIRFVGVWDTVSAYGGPFAELTRAIDNWIFPLSMPDYRLNGHVECARHALALDDERDAFHPLLWDEVHEEAMARRRPSMRGRLQQVWFTGMHSDVGGGYPDESLSYISLLWMMEEAEKTGLRTLDVIKARFVALASSAGPIHDSRKGVAAYYRYQPRKIAAWLDPVDRRTLALRDPQVTDAKGRPQGLLRSVKVHESVIARIANGTDRYAPITLPERFVIVPPQAVGENVPQADSEAGGGADGAAHHAQRALPAGAPLVHPLVAPALRARLTTPEVQAARAKAFEAVYDRVWKRRVTYFVTLAVTLLLAALPFWVDYAPEPLWLGDGRTWIDAPLRAIGLLVPSIFAFWVNAFADNPFYFLVLALGIWGLMTYGARCERGLRDKARHIWHDAVAVDRPTPAALEPGRLARFRNAAAYQRSIQVAKWTALPIVLVLVIAAVGVWLALAGITQSALPWLETGAGLCASTGDTLPELVNYRGAFRTDATCHPVGQRVVKGQRYHLELREEQPWFDGTHATNALGLRPRDLGLVGYLGGPFRRVIEANYLQPIVEIRTPRPEWWRFDTLHMLAAPLSLQEPRVYAVDFTADHDGELFLFANDAVSLHRLDYFYTSDRGRNHGTAALTVVRLANAPAAK